MSHESIVDEAEDYYHMYGLAYAVSEVYKGILAESADTENDLRIRARSSTMSVRREYLSKANSLSLMSLRHIHTLTKWVNVIGKIEETSKQHYYDHQVEYVDAAIAIAATQDIDIHISEPHDV